MIIKKTIKTPKRGEVKKIPMDREMVKSMGEFFGTSIQNVMPEEDDNFLNFFVKRGSTELNYRFDKNVIDKIKGQLNLDKEETQINIGRRAGRLWLTLIVLAYEQSGTFGKFKYSDIIRLWSARESGQIYEDIRNLFISLSGANFILTKNEKGKKDTVIMSFINSARISENEDMANETIFHFELNENALGITANWIKYGSLSTKIQRDGYLSLPITDLSEKFENINYINFRERLRLFGGGEIKGITILEDWIKLSKDKLLRRSYCHSVIIKCLDQAKKDKLIKHYKTTFKLNKNWKNNWKITIVK